jgi:hypothetical protein
MSFLVFTIEIPAILIDTEIAMTIIYFHYVLPEDYFIETTIDYELLKMNLPLSITQQVWALNL